MLGYCLALVIIILRLEIMGININKSKKRLTETIEMNSTVLNNSYFCVVRLIALKLHAVHHLDVKDYLKQSGRTPIVDVARNLFSNCKVPDFKDDEEKRLR